MQKKKIVLDKYKIFEGASSIFLGSMLMLIALIIIFPGGMLNIVDNSIVIGYTKVDDVANSVAFVCGSKYNDIDKFLCVVDFYIENYNYSITEGTHKSPTETVMTGGDCLDTSYFYCSVFNLIDGFECDIVHLNNIQHAVNVVSFSGQYCDLDMTYYQCVGVGG